MKMKNIMKLSRLCLILAMLTNAGLASAQLYMMDNSIVTFFSDALIEDITATTKASQGLINASDKSFSFRVPIKTFEFAKDLMKEHFNENYMESEKFPYGTFKGTIDGNFDLTKNGVYEVVAKGVLGIHGVEQERSLPSKIFVEGSVVRLESVFIVKLVDHNIEIPQIVFQNIAEEIEVTVKSDLVPYKK
jgi:polyisoprenoid-binding protein YceI